MLFNSFGFLLVFFPVVLLVFYATGAAYRSSMPVYWLTAASVTFYAIGAAELLWLLCASIVFNYIVGSILNWQNRHEKSTKPTLFLGVSVNLGTLAYFKYSGMVLSSAAALGLVQPIAWTVTLPIGISFFTFTQIAFLVDAHQKKIHSRNFVEYALFVTYFPHLIAGPILHHTEMISQFQRRSLAAPNWNNLATGIALFSVGLAKKVLIADTVAPFADAVFSHSAQPISASDSWLAAIAYTMQLYFDFSGYCDMAIGISRMLNIDLPLNFYSPYKATSIIDFWRRWHMTLSRFLRDYLYIPLGGSRHDTARTYLNLTITMVLGGLWHGAAWTFVAWGTLHGLFLLINHAWRRYLNAKIPSVLTWLLTFVCVVVGWVFFRSNTFADAARVLFGMTGANGFTSAVPLIRDQFAIVWIGIATVVALLFPNSQQLFNLPFVPQSQGEARPIAEPFSWGLALHQLKWQPSKIWTASCTIMLVSAILLFRKPAPFLYFQF
jgi:D-alanyl-lipoteichoic acid acyltransferase DltB (MBOAT superfamily)